jgi:hypothetical protein
VVNAAVDGVANVALLPADAGWNNMPSITDFTLQTLSNDVSIRF